MAGYFLLIDSEDIMQKSLWFLGLSTLCSIAYANEINRTPEQNEVKIAPVLNESARQEGLLKQETLTVESKPAAIRQYSAEELVQNPEIFEALFVQALISPQKEKLVEYTKLYPKVANADISLIEWANAILLRDKDLNESVSIYRNLITSFPDNPYIRFQLAETLFYNQEYEAAKTQFEKLRAENNNQKDIAVFNRFIDVIEHKEHWNFSFGASFLNDKNLANSAKQGTTATLPNGAIVTYNTPRQSGQGISAWFSTDKRWNTENGKYFKLNTSLFNKYYWDNKKYNDVNLSTGLGFGYSNAQFSWEFMPTVAKRWYSGGVSGSESLKQYIDTYGTNISANYWLSQKVKYSFYYDYSYEYYRNPAYHPLYSGAMHTLVNSLTYLPDAKQSWALSLDLMNKNAKDKSNAYNRIGSRITWGQEWPLGISTSTTLGIAKRNYKEASFFGEKQENKEYSVNVSLWHKTFHFAGFTPRVTYSYTKTDSNIPIYAYDKHQVLFNVGKSF